MPSGRRQWIATVVSLLALLGQYPETYDKTYGTLGALISLLIWLWLGNLAFLLGALFNAEGYRAADEGR
jgi:membrane protein